MAGSAFPKSGGQIDGPIVLPGTRPANDFSRYAATCLYVDRAIAQFAASKVPRLQVDPPFMPDGVTQPKLRYTPSDPSAVLCFKGGSFLINGPAGDFTVDGKQVTRLPKPPANGDPWESYVYLTIEKATS
jgi:hypothetical protein